MGSTKSMGGALAEFCPEKGEEILLSLRPAGDSSSDVGLRKEKVAIWKARAKSSRANDKRKTPMT